MKRTTTKDCTAEQVFETLNEALARAFTFFKPGHFTADGNAHHPRRLELCSRAGVDPCLVDLRCYRSISYTHYRDLAFGCGFDVQFELQHRRHGVEADVRVSWSSGGGGDPLRAMATASLHLEAATKAAQMKVCVEEAFRGFCGDSDGDLNRWREGCALMEAHLVSQQAKIREAAKAMEAEAH